MGTCLLLHLSFTTPTSLSLLTRSSSVASTAPNCGLQNSVSSSLTGRTRVNFQDEIYTDGDDGHDDFGFRGTGKQRIWWSIEDDDNWVDDDEEEEGVEFLIFKVIRAFGWMVPAIGISFLLGTGPNAVLMALAVPLGQTALSLVFDKVWGSTSIRPKPRTRTRTRVRTKKKPFVRPTEKTSQRKEENKTYKEKGSYQSWMAADDGSYKKRSKRVHKFGGWDELDDMHKVSRGKPSQKVDDELPKQEMRSKLTRTRRIRDTPLLLRLLNAVFPFLGSWTRFLF
ncbi:hypothetical protein JCGZ_23572 [Jatropha curcas]|uniref:Uncharacterized protein n=1 Tax=Jatropha curcas TaxID=180498 RepID=A0A067JW51_JATCU|nr:hypothetical protein JCGZ_23572 [Jatropha curcas]